jgi:hypothetical protein
MAVFCHAPWILIDSGLAKGRKLTSWSTIRQDLRNAGAQVVDEEVVVDQRLITSGGPMTCLRSAESSWRKSPKAGTRGSRRKCATANNQCVTGKGFNPSPT